MQEGVTYREQFVLLAVVVDDGLGDLVERGDALRDRLLVVVRATARLAALQQALLHRLVGHLEVHAALARRDLCSHIWCSRVHMCSHSHAGSGD